jgi:hypothetical protein
VRSRRSSCPARAEGKALAVVRRKEEAAAAACGSGGCGSSVSGGGGMRQSMPRTMSPSMPNSSFVSAHALSVLLAPTHHTKSLRVLTQHPAREFTGRAAALLRQLDPTPPPKLRAHRLGQLTRAITQMASKGVEREATQRRSASSATARQAASPMHERTCSAHRPRSLWRA